MSENNNVTVTDLSNLGEKSPMTELEVLIVQVFKEVNATRIMTQQILNMLKEFSQVIEGVASNPMLGMLGQKFGIELPNGSHTR
jgi:hypothetical protein